MALNETATATANAISAAKAALSAKANKRAERIEALRAKFRGSDKVVKSNGRIAKRRTKSYRIRKGAYR